MTRDPVSGKYMLGREIQVLASAAVAHDPLLREGQVAVRALRDEIGHTCSLASLDGESIVFLLVEEGTRPIRVQWTRPGDRLPASTTAAGKVLLMDRSDAEVLRLVREHGLPRLTPKSITSRDVFLREIRRARREGLASHGRRRRLASWRSRLRCATSAPRWPRSASRARRTS